MGKRNILMEWEIAPEDSVWHQAKLLATAVGTTENEAFVQPGKQPLWRQPLTLATFGLVLLALIVAGCVLWWQAQAGIQLIQTELQDTVELEAWSVQADNHAIRSALLDTAASDAWRSQLVRHEQRQLDEGMDQEITILDVTLQDDLAMVLLQIEEPNGVLFVPYRTVRFYRFVDGSWLRTAPATQFWGSTQTLETDSFVIHFRHVDRDAVQAAVARIDAIYAQLRRDVGLDERPADKVKIDVVLQVPSIVYLTDDPDRITVLSPLVQKIPQNLSNGTMLTQAIMYHLAHHTISEARRRENIQPEWNLLLLGLQLWQADGGSEPALHWKQALARSHNYDAPAIRAEEREPTGVALERLWCDSWYWGHISGLNPSPAALCHDAEWRARLRYLRSGPQELQQIVYPSSFDYPGNDSFDFVTEQFDSWIDQMAAGTVIAYLVETYGRERLPLLMDGMRRHDTWEELVPHVVGVSAEEFEVGWQAYVATAYGGESQTTRSP